VIRRKHHEHIQCIVCGKVEELRSDDPERTQDRIAAEGGCQALDHVHQLFGLYRDCRARDSTPTGKG
jgi:Fur family ferric uptake transcriptional regulator